MDGQMDHGRQGSARHTHTPMALPILGWGHFGIRREASGSDPIMPKAGSIMVGPIMVGREERVTVRVGGR